MRIVALVKGTDHVCTRYRLAGYLPYFRHAGYAMEIHAWPRKPLTRWWFFSQLRDIDVLILQRRVATVRQLNRLRQAARVIVCDFDDAIYYKTSQPGGEVPGGQRLQKFTNTIREVDYVVGGNRFLCRKAAETGTAAAVTLIPTCLDTRRYPVAGHNPARPKADLVWIGSASTLRGLADIQDVLEAVGQAGLPVRLKLICDQFLQLNHLHVLRCPWSEGREAADLADADIGISWLPDNEWSEGKCGLKVLQYMAAGLPVIANPVGVQRELVIHGTTGLLVRTGAEFVDAVRQLAGNPLARRSMGLAGRRLVEERFDTSVGAGLWLQLLHQIRRSIADDQPGQPGRKAV